MASTSAAAWCALVALSFWTAVGHAVLRRLVAPTLALPFAPVAGWAIHSAVALPIFFVVPWSAWTIALVGLLLLVASHAVLGRARATGDGGPAIAVPAWCWLAAAILATLCAAAIVPKQVGDAVVLSEQIFDHAKVSMVADMARLGVPPGNPFRADDAGSGHLSYYYLLHFSSAELSRLLGVTGWEADIAMTFVATFASLAAMMGLAVRFSGRASAAAWVVVVAASSSARPVFVQWFGSRTLDAWVPGQGGLGGWLFQSAWVPQHLMSTSCVLLALLLMHGLSTRRSWPTVVALALVMAAAFESSTWVGGLVFAVVAAVVVPLLLVQAPNDRRIGLVTDLAVAGVVAIVLVAPLLADQLAAARLRGAGFPVTVRLYEVFGKAMDPAWRRRLDGPAFWLVVLPMEAPAAYIAGLFVLLRALTRWRGPVQRAAMPAFAVAALASIAASWLLVSTIADNNDLGWRALLLASVVLIPFAAAGIASWTVRRRHLAVALAIVAVLAGLPEGFHTIQRNLAGTSRGDGRAFADAPAMWQRVRQHTGPTERVASDPFAFATMTPWPVNIGWSLLADRRSCYAGWELTQVFTAIPHDRLRDIDARFVRVFAGKGTGDDIASLATTDRCDVVVLTARDGAWAADPFAGSASYRLVDEEAGRWRIYRRAS